MIYLDNAATTVSKPPQVADAVALAMKTLANSGRGTNEKALDALRTVYDTRERLAAFFGCTRAEHVVFTHNATEALNTALFGILEPGDHVITTDLEHNSVLRPLYALQRERDIQLSFVRADGWGNIDCEEFSLRMKPETRAIVCTHASNVTGFVVDIDAVSEIARKNDVLFILDASQTAGCLPIDLHAQGIDVLCFTGHKGLMGPQGTGGLCIGEGVEIRPLKCGGTGMASFLEHQPSAYPERLEAGTLNGHGIAGLSAAVEWIQRTGLEAIHRKEMGLARRFYEGVAAVEGVTLYGDFGRAARVAIVTLNVGEMDAAFVSDELSSVYGIATRPGAHCAPRIHRALGTQDRGAVRFSFGWYNTEQEVDRAVEAIREIAT